SAHPTTIYNQNVSMHVVACRRRQKDSSAGEVFRFSPTTGGGSFENLPISSFVLLGCFRVIGAHVAGGNCVDIDTMNRPFIGEGFGQLRNCSFGGSISWNSDSALER